MARLLATLLCMISLLVGYAPAVGMMTQASSNALDLRATLTQLLGEHVLLTAATTNAVLRGNESEYAAASLTLDANSVDLTAIIGASYGAEVKDAFLEMWREYVAGFIALAAGNEAKAEADLAAYPQGMGVFLANINTNLSEEVIIPELTVHGQQMKRIIEALRVKDYRAAYSEMRTAFAHTAKLALALADAIARQFPDQFAGQAGSDAAGLEALLLAQLAEHTALATLTTNAALQNRSDEFEAAAAALDDNSVELSLAVASIYGAEAGDVFLPLWRKHIGFFVDYTMGLATHNKAMQDEAITNLDAYRQDFATFLAGANPSLGAVAVLLLPHIQRVRGAASAQATGDYTGAYLEFRAAYRHAAGLGRTLATAFIGQFPERFSHQDQPVAMPATGHQPGGQPVETRNEMKIALGGLVALIFAAYFFVQRQRNVDEVYQEEEVAGVQSCRVAK